MVALKTNWLIPRVVCITSIASLVVAVAAIAQESPPTPPPDNAAAPASDAKSGLNLDMKLDDLARQDVVIPGFSQVVNTVERTESTVGRTPAAVFVITPEMIKRSGARHIPDVLRMAPGVDVAKIGSDIWAVSIRGFNDRLANKLLVQIDGRVVYQPQFGGVYWNQQDMVLADVERIEVIRGPGTTMWGSNAVNGVINIISKKSSDTQGLLVQSGGGADQERDFNTVRYGGKHSDDLTWRVYGKDFNCDRAWANPPPKDAWQQSRGGFRMDYTPNDTDTITLQGDVFTGNVSDNNLVSSPTPPFVGPSTNNSPPVDGANLIFRYGQILDDDTSWQVQTYYDHYSTTTAGLYEYRDTYDLDLQYQFSPVDDHHFIVGANYRNSPDRTRGNFTVQVFPAEDTTLWAGVFAQDTMTLEEDRWYFTLGTRLEYNTFGKFQPEPTARLLFLPSERQSIWAAVSRAVRNPTRGETGSDIHQHVGPPNSPTFVNLLGDPNLEPEALLAYEIGYRAAPTDFFTWDVAGYINDYRKLRGFDSSSPPVVVPPGLIYFPVLITNGLSALSYGGEITANVQLTEDWRIYGAYSLFEINAQGAEPGVSQLNGNSPNNQIYLSSSWDLSHDIQFDLIGRYVDKLAFADVPKYFEMDVRIGWQATKALEFSFVGQNLLDGHHLEFSDAITGLPPTEVRRSWYGMITWTF